VAGPVFSQLEPSLGQWRFLVLGKLRERVVAPVSVLLWEINGGRSALYRYLGGGDLWFVAGRDQRSAPLSSVPLVAASAFRWALPPGRRAL
jgi:hypothetical protein